MLLPHVRLACVVMWEGSAGCHTLACKLDWAFTQHVRVQLRHAEYQSQCSQHKDRLQRLQTTYYALKAACDKRLLDLHRIDRALEDQVNAK